MSTGGLPTTTRESVQYTSPQHGRRDVVQFSYLAKARSHMNHDIKADIRLEAVLMLLSVAAGINDATTFPDYGVFAGNQTGNTALLAVSGLDLKSGRHKVNIRLVAISLGMFILGALLAGWIANRVGRLNRGWLFGSNVFQTILIWIAAALRRWYATDNAYNDRSLSVVALLAFQSAPQVAMARTTGIAEVATAMLTSAYVDCLVDPGLLAKHNRGRNRRVVFVLSFMIGVFIGAIGFRYQGPAFSLMLSAIVKTLVCLAILALKAKVDPVKEGKQQNRVAGDKHV